MSYIVRATKIEKKEGSKVIGLASMVVDGKFAFNSLRIIESENAQRGFFVSMPSYKTKDGDYIDLFHPTTSEMVNAIADAVGKSMNSGEPVEIGKGETKISTFTQPVSYKDSAQIAKVTLRAGDMICDSVAVRKSQDGELFVGFPGYQKKDGDYANYCNPTTREFKEELTENVLSQYRTAQEKKYAVNEVKKEAKKQESISVEVPDKAR